MKVMPSLRKHHSPSIFSVFLITMTLMVGMVGCGSGQYSLTIYSTEGGWAWQPSGEISDLDYGAVVSIEAWAYICHEFVNWTGDVGTIADVEDGSTTITMHGSYVITANFVPKAVESMEIWDWYDLDAIRDNLCWNYTLMSDLDSTTPGYEELAGPIANGGSGWEPIGFSDTELKYPFKGILNGQGYELHGMFIQREAADSIELGLFGLSYGVIENIGVVDATVIGNDALCVGVLVGMNEGTVSNSYSTGNVSTDADYGGVGGLVGVNSEGTVMDSYSTACVISSGCIGGLIGANYHGTINNCYSTGNVSGEHYVGGLVGGNYGTVSNSYCTGSVTGDEFAVTGGLVEINEGTVSNSFWDTQTSGQATSNGGTGKSTAAMQNITTFSGAGWDITEVSLNETNPAYVWNIVDGLTYPFLSWQP
jgi:hypothetical protein